jgi:hypothetical protein
MVKLATVDCMRIKRLLPNSRTILHEPLKWKHIPSDAWIRESLACIKGCFPGESIRNATHRNHP